MFTKQLRKSDISSNRPISILRKIIQLFIYSFLAVTTSNHGYILPDNSISENIIIYQSSTFLSNGIIHEFQHNFPLTFPNIPQVAFAISGLKGNDQLRNQLFNFKLKQKSLISMIISYQSVSPTKIIFFKISYFALDDIYNIIEVIEHEFTSFEIIDLSENNYRVQTLEFEIYPVILNKTWKGQYFVNGAYFRSDSMIDLNFANMTLLNQTSISIQVIVETDIRFQKLTLLFVFYYQDSDRNQNFPDLTLIQISNGSQIIENGQQAYLLDYTERQRLFIMGISAFSHNTYSIQFSFQWSYTIINDTTAIQYDFSHKLFEKLQFNYFSYAQIQCYNDYLWEPYLLICVNSCFQNQTNNPLDNICLNCDSLCLTCQDTARNCSSCYDRYELSNYTCVQIQKDNDQNNQQKQIAEDNDNEQQMKMLHLLALIIIPIMIIIMITIFIYRSRKKKIANKHEQIKDHPTIQI